MLFAHKTPDGTELGRRHTDDDRVVVVYDIIRGVKPVFPAILRRRIIKIIIRALENEDLRRGRRTHAAAHKTPVGAELGRRHRDDGTVVVVYDIIRRVKPVFPAIRRRRIIKIIIRALENEDLRRGR
ncbi:hypothetical protein CDAR_211341 [Caerostris darwini]|uniref:Uncharacterized protein n=1 Tax=Caerostris darwini TaxID=1538125 RepID=A0AAV4VYK7_9ARAC|nr:hypothetical protein CDAR_211341 [Caerostris darwini]